MVSQRGESVDGGEVEGHDDELVGGDERDLA
jgi:hypothetical protein